MNRPHMFCAVRLIELMRMLDERGWTVSELSAHLGVSKRTIYRDLLSIQGEPLRYPLVQKGLQFGHMRLMH